MSATTPPSEGKCLSLGRHGKSRLLERSFQFRDVSLCLSKLDVKSITMKNVAFVRPDEMLEFAAALMAENKISSLPVLDERDKLVGIVTKTDIFKAFIHITGFYAGGIQFGFRLEDRPGSIKEAADTIRRHGGCVISILSTKEMAEKGQRDVYIRPPEWKERVCGT